jgi:sialic acid synthase SpsE/endonuclease IV
MVIDKNISQFIIYCEDSLIKGLQKMSDNKSGILFAINEKGILLGILTDGDIRRWLISNSQVNLEISVSHIMNRKFTSSYVSETSDIIRGKFNADANIKFIPLIDENHHLIAIARMDNPGFKIGDKVINDQSPSFIIAEIGNNHNGDVILAKKLIRLAKESGADCAKFQMRNLKTLYKSNTGSSDLSEDLGSQYVLDLLERFQLSDEDLFDAFNYCKEIDIIPLCTPWDKESLFKLNEYGLEAFKVASADLTNHDLILQMISTGKPLIISTGMSTEDEIKDTAELLRNHGASFCLLHCNSAYPAPFKDVHLNYIEKLKTISSGLIGYSGHERGIAVAIASIAKGAKIIEKHFTIDKTMEGNDHKVSLLPDEFKEMVAGIRQVEESLGGTTKLMSQGEMMNRENLAKSLVIKQDLKIGETILESMLDIRSPGKGLQPNRKKDLIGRKATRNLKAGDILFLSDIMEDAIKARDYNFPRVWGVPVRYHDYKQMLGKTNLELLEFHLSYKDLDENLESLFNSKEKLPYKLVVHSPELFQGDHILDLCSENETYRQRSIQEFQRVINVTRDLQKFFNQKNTPIVTNVGGFDLNGFVSAEKRKILYALFLDSLGKVDMKDVEVIPQTMPPFPWHFGGQSHHNLFVDPDEIAEICQNNKMRICFDISHSQLACNYYNISMTDFFKKVGTYVSHMHIADAKGHDGEGLQIGEGTMDFKHLCELIAQYSPKDSTFIPEVWQGHKNGGEGFWFAMDKLENAFGNTK